MHIVKQQVNVHSSSLPTKRSPGPIIYQLVDPLRYGLPCLDAIKIAHRGQFPDAAGDMHGGSCPVLLYNLLSAGP